MIKAIASLAILMLISSRALGQVHGASQTGNGFLQTCSRDAAGTFQTGCISYFAGIADTLVQIELTKPQRDQRFCLPQGVVYGQMTDITLDFLRKNPSLRHQPTPQLVWTSLVQAFPCSK
jgi:hypothetical protein